jgi:hypothetical protein
LGVVKPNHFLGRLFNRSIMRSRSLSMTGLKSYPSTRQGEHEVRSQGARDRGALTGEAGNASRRQVIAGDMGMNPVGMSACRTQDGRGPILVA